jgi:hypothetical protein
MLQFCGTKLSENIAMCKNLFLEIHNWYSETSYPDPSLWFPHCHIVNVSIGFQNKTVFQTFSTAYQKV